MYKKIAIVGITGDPPTVGHIWLARTADRTGNFDGVWLMPCYGHKFGKKTTTPKHRLEMTKIAARDAGGMVVASSFEIDQKHTGSAYSTIDMLRTLNPLCEFTWVIGMDNALILDSWENSGWLKENVPFLVCHRPGVETPDGFHWFHKPPHSFVEGEDAVECSSSEFRTYFRQSDPQCVRMVTPNVLKYIVDHGLYRGVET